MIATNKMETNMVLLSTPVWPDLHTKRIENLLLAFFKIQYVSKNCQHLKSIIRGWLLSLVLLLPASLLVQELSMQKAALFLD